MRSEWLRLGLVTTLVGVVVSLSACGGDDDDDKSPSAGAPGVGGAANGGTVSGQGGSTVAGAGAGGGTATVTCGSSVCQPVNVGLGLPPLAACCANAATSQCGLDTSILGSFGGPAESTCEPLAQPGAVDTECANSPPVMLPGSALALIFKGCCREDDVCGYLVERVPGIIPVSLGCVNATQFLEEETAPTACSND
ncbi:MAG TPA: hypothetical protein VER33_07500 [Polyangiaceae bacterium]|nr:hypothetical protein [Polyangiaceae bacterium]